MSRKKLIKSSIFSSCAIIALLLSIVLIYGTKSYGWFSNSTSAEANNMQVVLLGDAYDIYIPKTTKYNNDNVYEGINAFKSILTSEGKVFNNTNDSTPISGQNLAFELDNELSDSSNPDVFYLVPGSYGSFTFYVYKKVDTDIMVDLNLSLYGYKKKYEVDENENEVVVPYIPNNNASYNKALDMLKGHLLFFENRTVDSNGVPTSYSGLINDTNTISYSTAGKSKDSTYTDYYKVTIYWEWPLLYEDIVNNISTNEVSAKYPSAVGTYLNSHRNYFFAINENSSITIELSDGYNNGDQLIGDNIHYLIVKLG